MLILQALQKVKGMLELLSVTILPCRMQPMVTHYLIELMAQLANVKRLEEFAPVRPPVDTDLVQHARELAQDERFIKNSGRLQHRAALLEILESHLRTLHKDSLLASMEAESIPGGPINTLPDAFTSPQAVAREMVVKMAHPLSGSGHVELIGNPLKFSRTPVTYRRAPPVCGADTDEVLRELLGDDLAVRYR